MPPEADALTVAPCDLCRVRVAQLQWQVAQLQAQLQLQTQQTAYEAVLRQVLLTYVPAADVAHVALDLDTGTIMGREQNSP